MTLVDGCEIAVRAQGIGDPALVLVHGGGGHTHWWDGVLARLDRQRVVAMDFSGHGDSGRRTAYAMSTWADEIGEVIAAHAGGRAVVIGHSMGGRVGTLAAARHPDAVHALVLVDAAVPLDSGTRLPTVRPKRTYPSREAAQAAFHLLPRQPGPDATTLASLAHDSVVEDESGAWTWKFDPRVYEDLRDEETERRIRDIACPVMAVHGEHSVVTCPAVAAEFERRLGRYVPLVTIPGAHHHVPLDAPAALGDLLAWLPETRPR